MVETCRASLHKLATPQTKKVITDAARCSARIIWTLRHVSRTVRDSTTPGDCNIDVRFPRANYPDLIGVIGILPPRGNIGSLKVFNEQKSTVSDETRDTQNFDNYVDTNLANIGDSTSIFSKLIGCELSHSSSANLYLICQMDFFSNTVRTKGPNFVDLGILAVNESDEVNIFGTPATRIRRTTDGTHWSAPDHFFVKATVFGISATR